MNLLKALRRSIKGDKENKPHISIAPKSAVAIVPPKKVRLDSEHSIPRWVHEPRSTEGARILAATAATMLMPLRLNRLSERSTITKHKLRKN